MRGDRLRECRLRYGESQEDLADFLGVAVRTVANWENGRMVSLGDRSRPPTERRIARQLDRLDRLVAAARAVETSEAPTSM